MSIRDSDVNDLIAIMYADNPTLDDIRTTKLIINTFDLEDADSDIMQAMVVVSSLEDVCMFIHEVVEDSNLVDENYKINFDALNLVNEYVSNRLGVDIYYAHECDDKPITDNALVITKIDIHDGLVIIDIL